MPEAVIVSVARTPIGRAMKGSLKNERPDDLTAFIVDTALNKIPEQDRNLIEDLYLGCGQPAGESGVFSNPSLSPNTPTSISVLS